PVTEHDGFWSFPEVEPRSAFDLTDPRQLGTGALLRLLPRRDAGMHQDPVLEPEEGREVANPGEPAFEIRPELPTDLVESAGLAIEKPVLVVADDDERVVADGELQDVFAEGTPVDQVANEGQSMHLRIEVRRIDQVAQFLIATL